VAKKTKEELGEELHRAITEAKAQYNSVVGPAQEAYRAVEQKARIILEQTIDGRSSEIKDKDRYLIQPIQSELIHEWDTPKRKQVSSSEKLDFQKLLDMPREVSPETYEFFEPYIIEIAIQNNIEATKDTYGKTIKNAMSDYYKIEKPAKAERDVAIRLANQHYDEALKELRKVDDWFEYRRTYQRSLRPDTHEEIKAMKAAPECSVDIACTGRPQSTVTRLKCHFCGDSKARTEAGLNQVKYRLKHPGAGFWSTLLGRNWKYACQDCVDYMIHLWGNVEMKPVGLPVVDRDLDYQKMVAEEKQ